MLKKHELGREIADKRTELEKLQREENLPEALKVADELNKLVDEYNIEVAKEKSDFENFLKDAEPLHAPQVGTKNKRGGIAGESYSKSFWSAVRARFKNQAGSYLRESSLPDGGYLVPEEFQCAIVTELEQENVLRQLGTTITTAAKHKIPIVSTKPAAAWIGEAEEINFSNEQFGQISLEAFKLAVAIKVSNELLADSYYPIEEHLTQEFVKAFARAEEDAFLNGSPDPLSTAKTPTGLLTTLAASPSTTIETSRTTLAVEDLINLEFSLQRPYRRNAIWLVSDSLVGELRRMKDGVQRFIFEPSLVAGEPERLFGKPIYTSPYMPTLASGNIIALYGDFKDYYLIGERGERIFKPLRELYAMSDQTAFLMLERVDAKLTNISAIKALKLKSGE